MMALSSRLVTARSTCSGEAVTRVGSSFCVKRTAGARRRALCRALSTIWSSATSSAMAGVPAPRASSTTSATSAVRLSSSSMMSARRPSLSSGDSRSACSSVWMFARSVAIGVRSSCEASATRWRCACTDRSSASSVALKLRARRASSSRPCTSSRCEGSGSAVSASVRRVKRDTGASAARATSIPRIAATAIPPTPTAISTTSSRSSERSTSVSGRATWTAPPSASVVANMRRWTPSTVVSLKNGGPPFRASFRVALSTGSARDSSGGRRTVPPGSTICT